VQLSCKQPFPPPLPIYSFNRVPLVAWGKEKAIVVCVVRHYIWRPLRILLGFALLLIGAFLSLPGVPGPGIVVMVFSLGILSHDFHWAKRSHGYLQQKWQQVVRHCKRADRGEGHPD
jgi:hypothetical protein